jgi:hypothetical protein
VKESEERKFLHDIASPLGTAMFVVDMMLDGMKARPGAGPQELRQAQQVLDVLGQIKKAIEQRREVLIKQGVPSSKAAS